MIGGMNRGRLLLVGGVAATVAALGSYAGLAATSATAVKVTENDVPTFKLIAVPLKVKAGKVTFVVKNIGHLDHEFLVIKTTRAADKLPVAGAKAVETGRVGKIPVFKPGQTRRLVLTLKPGRYVLLCNVPGHYQGGQRAAFRVG